MDKYVIVLNPDPNVWDLRSENGKIDVNKLINQLKTNGTTSRDFYTFDNVDSAKIECEVLLKDEFINQVAYNVYGIDLDKFIKIENDKNYYDKYNELFDRGEIKNANLCVLKAGYQKFEELKEAYDKHHEIYLDIISKYKEFHRALEEKGLLTYESSLIARHNSANELSSETFDVNMKNSMEISNTFLKEKTTEKESAEDSVSMATSEFSSVQNQYDNINCDYEEAKEKVDSGLKAKNIAEEEYNSSLVRLNDASDFLQEVFQSKSVAEEEMVESTEVFNTYMNYLEKIEAFNTKLLEMQTEITNDNIDYDINELIELKVQLNEIHVSSRIIEILFSLDQHWASLIDVFEDDLKAQILTAINDIIEDCNALTNVTTDEKFAAEIRKEEKERAFNVIEEKYETALKNKENKLRDSEEKETILENYVNSLNSSVTELNETSAKRDTINDTLNEKRTSLEASRERLDIITNEYNITKRDNEIKTRLYGILHDFQQKAIDEREEVAKEIMFAERLKASNEKFIQDIRNLATNKESE